jgi:hypothetical protein
MGTVAAPSPAAAAKTLMLRLGRVPDASLQPLEAQAYIMAHAELVRIAGLLMHEPAGLGLLCRGDGHVYWLQDVCVGRVDLVTTHVCNDGWVAYDDMVRASERELGGADLAGWPGALATAVDERRLIRIDCDLRRRPTSVRRRAAA